MKTIAEIVELSKQYDTAHRQMNERHQLWNETIKEQVENTLEIIKTCIIEQNPYFKSNLFVVNGKSKFVCLKSGAVPIPDSEGELEQGFQIYFWQLPNGKIHVYSFEHSPKENNSRSHTIELIDDLSTLNEEKIMDLTYYGIEKAMNSSFLFL